MGGAAADGAGAAFFSGSGCGSAACTSVSSSAKMSSSASMSSVSSTAELLLGLGDLLASTGLGLAFSAAAGVGDATGLGDCAAFGSSCGGTVVGFSSALGLTGSAPSLVRDLRLPLAGAGEARLGLPDDAAAAAGVGGGGLWLGFGLRRVERAERGATESLLAALRGVGGGVLPLLAGFGLRLFSRSRRAMLRVYGLPGRSTSDPGFGLTERLPVLLVRLRRVWAIVSWACFAARIRTTTTTRVAAQSDWKVPPPNTPRPSVARTSSEPSLLSLPASSST